MWLDFGENRGPAREIHAGGGYWSQDSAVQVLSAPALPIKSASGGREAKGPSATFPPARRNREVDSAGKSKVLRQ